MTFKILNLNLGFLRSFSRSWNKMWISNKYVNYEDPHWGRTKWVGNFFFHFWENILLYIVYWIISYSFKITTLASAPLNLWYRCFPCWPLFLLLRHPSPLFSFPFMLAGHGEMYKFNICCVFIMDTQSLLFNKWTGVHRKSKKYSIVTKS